METCNQYQILTKENWPWAQRNGGGWQGYATPLVLHKEKELGFSVTILGYQVSSPTEDMSDFQSWLANQGPYFRITSVWCSLVFPVLTH